MDGKQLTLYQASKVYESVLDIFGFLTQLEARLLVLGFGPHDSLYDLVADARSSVHRLSVEVREIARIVPSPSDPAVRSDRLPPGTTRGHGG